VRDGLPPGWTNTNGIVGPGERVADFAARGQAVKGVCRSQGCFRKIDLDAHALCKMGLSALQMRQVQRLWMCQRLDGCGLDFHNELPALPLRLELFVGRPNIRLRLRCRGNACKFFRLYQVEQVIAGLEARKKGGGRTEVAALGALMSGPCPACGKSNWVAEMLYIDTSTMGWRALGEKAFDSVPKGAPP
jgi:hypothetical protein